MHGWLESSLLSQLFWGILKANSWRHQIWTVIGLHRFPRSGTVCSALTDGHSCLVSRVSILFLSCQHQHQHHHALLVTLAPLRPSSLTKTQFNLHSFYCCCWCCCWCDRFIERLRRKRRRRRECPFLVCPSLSLSLSFTFHRGALWPCLLVHSLFLQWPLDPPISAYLSLEAASASRKHRIFVRRSITFFQVCCCCITGISLSPLSFLPFFLPSFTP